MTEGGWGDKKDKQVRKGEKKKAFGLPHTNAQAHFMWKRRLYISSFKEKCGKRIWTTRWKQKVTGRRFLFAYFGPLPGLWKQPRWVKVSVFDVQLRLYAASYFSITSRLKRFCWSFFSPDISLDAPALLLLARIFLLQSGCHINFPTLGTAKRRSCHHTSSFKSASCSDNFQKGIRKTSRVCACAGVTHS